MNVIADEMCHSPILNIWILPRVYTDMPPLMLRELNM